VGGGIGELVEVVAHRIGKIVRGAGFALQNTKLSLVGSAPVQGVQIQA
jgi:hypothetical protein